MNKNGTNHKQKHMGFHYPSCSTQTTQLCFFNPMCSATMIQGGEERFLYAAGAEAEADSDSDVSLHSGGDSVPQRRDFSTGLCACFEDMDSCVSCSLSLSLSLSA